MTPASLHTRGRVGVALAGGLVAALVLTGCGSSDDGGGKNSADSTPSASGEASGAGGSSGGSDDSEAQDGLEGSWVTTSNGGVVALVINSGKAGLFDSKGTTCSGTGGKEMGMQMIKLKCADGSDDRSQGLVKSVNETTMKVSWEGFGDETYTRSKDGKLPSGLPTDQPLPPS